jgi:outer membrane receptor protein involved in Fe transport
MSDKISARRPHLLSLAALLGTTALSTMAVMPALAQDDGTQAPAPAPNAPAEKATPEITITGSRIVRRDFSAPSPTVTVQSQSFDQISTIGIENVMNQLPQFVPGGSGGGPGAGTQFGTGDVQATPFNSPGLSTLNLRGIGVFRNLVLIDGRRGQPANATLVVDINTIPAAAIDSVEIITGGASAVYGADAVSGVVNMKLKHDYEGITLDAQSGITQRGDGTETRISALVGGNFGGGRGNVMFGAEWDHRQGIHSIDRKWQRDFWSNPNTNGGAPDYPDYSPTAFSHPTQAAVDSVFSDLPPGSVDPTSQFFINPDGTIFTQSGPGASHYTGPVDGINTKIAADGSIQHNFTQGYMSSPLARYSFYGKAEYNLDDDITFYAQGMFSDVKVNQILNYAPATSFWIANPVNDANHPVPPELATLLNNRTGVFGPVAADAEWQLARNLDFLGARRSENLTTQYQLLAGFKGNLPFKDWTYDIYGSHGSTTIINNGYGYASTQRYFAVVQGVPSRSVPSLNDSPPSAPVPSVNWGQNFVYEPVLGTHISCTSGLPLYGDYLDAITQDCKDAIGLTLVQTTRIKQDIAEIDLQGGLFDLPAGELRGSLGADYRRDRSVYTPDTALDRESVFDHPVGLFPSNDSAGSTSVKEVYGELLIPVLKDLPAVQNIDLELGGRLSDYKGIGTIGTYKALTNWQVTSWLSLRGGYNRANRAPNVAESYTAPTQSVIFFPGADPCLTNTTNSWGNLPSNPNVAQVRALCSALNNNPGSQWDNNNNTNPGTNVVGPFPSNFPFEIGITSGNTNLKNETADTITIGGVIRSPVDSGVLSNMTMTLDYYSIKIKNEIQQADAWTLYAQCFNAFGDNPSYDPNYISCQAIHRAPDTGYRQSVDTQFINTGTLKTAGLDVAFVWNIAMSDIGISDTGSLNVNVQGNYLFSFKQQNAPGLPFEDDAGTLANSGHYRWRTTTNITYVRNMWSAGLRWIHLPSIKDAAYATNPATTNFPIGSYDNFSLYGSWSITDHVTLRAGIDNVLDSNPRLSGVSPTSAGTGFQTTYYDPIGRRFYGGVRFNM